MSEEHRIYNAELQWDDVHKMAREFGTRAAYVSRAIHSDDSPARRYIRWIRSLRATRPKAAERLHEWVLKQIKDEHAALEPVINWNQDAEVRELFREISEGFDAVLRNAPLRDIERELLCDVRRKLDRWERRIDAMRAEQEAPKLKGVAR